MLQSLFLVQTSEQKYLITSEQKHLNSSQQKYLI